MKNKNLFIFFIIILFLFIFLGREIYFPDNSLFKGNKNFLINKGESFLDISDNLQKEGIIKNKFVLDFYLVFTGNFKKLKAGEYLLNSTMNIPQIVKKFVEGDVIKEKITIIEGWNLRDIGFYFENKGLFQAEELWELAGFPAVDYSKNIDLPKLRDFSQDYDFLKDKPKNVGLEGYLFPDTYEIKKGDSLDNVIGTMLSNFGKKLTPSLREEIRKQGKTIFEIVTIASLLEKEVKTKEEKEIVSGILWKRLKNKVPLQVDATIVYITGKNTTRISKKETQIDSPFNTYRYLGLPLGPICNPGLESIQAALYPKDSPFWYYLSVPDQGTLFSKTLQEHNFKKAKFLTPL